MGSIPLRIRVDEIVGFIKIYDEIRYLVLLWYFSIKIGMIKFVIQLNIL